VKGKIDWKGGIKFEEAGFGSAAMSFDGSKCLFVFDNH
jgi:hypothetical protein